MRRSNQLLDEIRARLSVSQVVARKVQLKRAGREFKGLSPFKQEKTPSFTVNDQKGFYHCFATGEHGDIFTFLMKTEGCSFPEAVEHLAEEAGVQLPQEKTYNPARDDQRKRLLSLVEQAASYFVQQLNSPAGQAARDYLDRRAIDGATAQAFQLGYAGDSRTALKSHFLAAGFTEAELIQSGMIIGGDDIPSSYDRFRHRLMFPIHDAQGRVVAFGGRALDPSQPAKYLNSPETPLFHKGALLYNAHRARGPAYEVGELVAVEGYMDAIALSRAGFEQAVAPLGTALTAEQMRLMWRITPEPILCFDGDAAGQKAAHRAI
ncbi:MAG: DNA primase, partial [Hyphomicrobiaceae bacterium]